MKTQIIISKSNNTRIAINNLLESDIYIGTISNSKFNIARKSSFLKAKSNFKITGEIDDGKWIIKPEFRIFILKPLFKIYLILIGIFLIDTLVKTEWITTFVLLIVFSIPIISLRIASARELKLFSDKLYAYKRKIDENKN